ncbi:solute:sodium symporter family transporter [Bacillus cytotoxicus]|uniref:Putativ Na+/solute symporter YidK n=1 Tax=Bacillus cytotoxicus TaxID=580165 RepID=A0AAX2CH01_9BACI|nr:MULTISPECIES: solute:sodium symporter family transporter [Bacillus cereus group]QTR69351.1 solute:sodium symporter family transporter [Bacillus cytotoxicus]QTR78049.1 solute:sodium symporter family transporter [Bacillus cytotoxicus]QTR82130.1 solute:sodium symporter family transporter [Bacillus cytotoxicus]QTR85868.1 solute:sodium symporter family transporter [Bacillus cytotoxicus]SCL92930.1 Putativ Na+/solute symporter YidK [Bacillus cytotoxicus]
MAFVTVITFLVYTIFIAWFSWYKTRHINLDSSDGYFLGGRSLTGIVIAGSLVLTNLSTEQMVGLNGQSYATSMVVMAWEVTAPLALIFMAFVFLPRYLKSGITTIPDFLEQRYDLRTRQIISILFLLGYAIAYLPTVLYSGALVLDSIFNISQLFGLSNFTTIMVIALIIGMTGIAYVVFGGLRACAISDTLNGIGLIIGGCLIPILGLLALGKGSIMDGVNLLLHSHPEKLNAIGDSQDSVPWTTIFMGLLFNNLFYWCTNQAIVQRALGAKNLAEGQKGVLLAGLFKVFGALYLVLPGIIAFHLFGDQLKNADMAYPMLVIKILPIALSGFFAAVLFGAILSSFNGALNSSITLFTLDFYKPIFKKEASEKELVKVGRIFAITLGLIAVIVSPFILYAPSGLYNYLQEMFGFYNVPIIAAVVVGFFSKKVPASAPKIALVFHIILYALSKVFLGSINFLYILSVLFPACVIVMLVIGKLKPRETDFELFDANKVDLKPWKYAKVFSIFLIIFMLGAYVLFSPVGLAAQ